MVTCEICGKEFYNNTKLSLHIKKEHPEISKFEYIKKYLYDGNGSCPICGKDRKMHYFKLLTTCGDDDCVVESRKKTSLIRYGVDNPSKTNEIKSKISNYRKELFKDKNVKDEIFNKNRKTYIAKYGVEHHSKTNKSKENFKNTCLRRYGETTNLKCKATKDKIKSTNLKRYGVESYTQTENYKKKSKQIYLTKYGVDNPNKLDRIKEKKKSTNINRYGVETYTKTKRYKDEMHKIYLNKFINNVKNNRPDLEFIEQKNDKYYKQYICKWKCLKCETIFEDYARATDNWLHPRCPVCNPRTYSSIENKVYNYLAKFIPVDEIIRCTKRVITPYELDLYIPHLSVAIECDGDYWHSDEFLMENIGMSNEEHCKLKYNLCKDKNITLLRFTESEIDNEFEKVKEIIDNCLGEYNEYK